MRNDSVGTRNVRLGRDSHGAADAIRPGGDEKEVPSLIRKSRVQGPLQSLSIVTDAVSFRPEIIGPKLTASRRREVKSATFVHACFGSSARSPAERSRCTSGESVTTRAGGESPACRKVAPAGARLRRYASALDGERSGA